MPLLKTVLLPHSPLLIPEIGKANHGLLQKTSSAYNKIAEDLKKLNIDTVIIISPHGLTPADSFGLNVAPEMKINLKDFGFIPAQANLTGDMVLADKINNQLKDKCSLQMTSEEELDHGSAIPAYLLNQDDGDFKLIIISPPEQSTLAEQVNFGRRLGRVIKAEEKRVAVIASGDLSHRLKKKSPGGYSPKGAKFDNKIIEYLNEPATAKKNIIKMDPNFITAAGECGLKSITILLGILNNIDWQPEVLAYQNDFGVGYLSMDFIL